MTVTDWAARVHAAHTRLGVTLANCDACRKADTRPEWVRRASERRLVAKDYSGAAR